MRDSGCEGGYRYPILPVAAPKSVENTIITGTSRQLHCTCSMSRFDLAVKARLVSRGTSVRIRFGSPFPSKVVVSGPHCLVTLSLTVNETLKWLASLPIL